jgi:hypothetical protein
MDGVLHHSEFVVLHDDKPARCALAAIVVILAGTAVAWAVGVVRF